jgi:hypothetical protein
MQYVVNTTQRLGQRLTSFRKGYVTNLASNTPGTDAQASSPPKSMVSFAPATPAPPTTNSTITNYASASSLLEFYCSVLETGADGNSGDIDLIYLTRCDSKSQEDFEKRQLYYRKTKKQKLDTNNLSSISFDEQYEFDLNENTKYVNICLWVPTIFKLKPKSILVGYVS